MPFTNYADGTVIFAAQLNADNATSLDLNTATTQTLQGGLTLSGLLTTQAVTTNGVLTLKGGTINNVKLITTGASYTMLPTDRYIFCQTSAAITIALISSPTQGRTITVKDSGGTAGTGNITILPAAGFIDGITSYVISANYGTATFIYSGSRWLSGA
jgi:hypothetical protein